MEQYVQTHKKENIQRISGPLNASEKECKFMKVGNIASSAIYWCKPYEIKCRNVNENVTLSNKTEEKIRDVIEQR